MKIVLPGKPISTNSLYRHKGHIVFMTKEGKERKEYYQKEAWVQRQGKIIVDDIAILVRLYFPDKKKRDWDNFHKLAMDALNKIVWGDDSQIKRALVEMHYDKENPRTEICIYPLTHHF